MKKPMTIIVICLLTLGLSYCKMSNKKSEDKPQIASSYPGYQPFPDGYDYFKKNEQLKQAVTQKNRRFIRDHGWKLWAGIMQQGKGINWPVWYTWPTVTQTMKLNQKSNANLGNSLIAINQNNQPKSNLLLEAANGPILDDIVLPIYPLPEKVAAMYPNAVSNVLVHYKGIKYNLGSVNSGMHVASNGDVMIVTESFSIEAYDWVAKNKLYSADTLTKKLRQYKHGKGPHGLKAVPRWISTKHMYWPVLKDQLGVLPVWNNDFDSTYRDYAGYEKWKTIVAIDPSNKLTGDTTVTYLYGVLNPDTTPMPSITANASIYGIDDFYYHQITKEDWEALPDADKAAINASSYWAYNKPFGIGDYLVTIASHINTKEVNTWALQSVWWSDKPDEGKFSKNRPNLPNAKGPWENYLLTDAYGLPNNAGQLEVAMNPYIELVIHPVATNCNNCHQRAGWPNGPHLTPDTASYQNAGCEDLLKYLNPNDSCLDGYLLSDYIWVIPDRAH